MLRELIAATVVAEPDMIVVGAYPADIALDTAADGADLVITGVARPTGEELARVLGERPDLVVVAVVDGGRQSVLFHGGAERELGELSPRAIVAATRAFQAGGAG